MERSTGKSTVQKAKQLRRSMSLPEVMLWQILRTKPDGLKFRRQHPVGPYILDFYCAPAKLAIEIDGISHDMGERPGRDARRYAVLKEQNIEIVRIRAQEVLDNVEEVGEQLVGYAEAKR